MTVLRGEILALLAACEEAEMLCPDRDTESFSISVAFSRLRPEKIQEAMIALEDMNKEAAALVQKILDGSGGI